MEDTTVTGCAGCLIVLAIFLILVPAAIAISAFVTMWAWNIFLVPVFHLPTLTFLQALGFWILVGVIKGIFSITISKKE